MARKTPELKTPDLAWCRRVASVSVGALFSAKIVQLGDMDRAIEIVTEEILSRLAVQDWPVSEEKNSN